MRTSLLAAILLAGVIFSDGYKILGVFPTMSKSHYILGSAMMKKLADEGHEVTVLTPFPGKEKSPNFNEVLVDGLVQEFEKTDFNVLDMRDTPVWKNIFNLYGMGVLISNFTLTHPVVQDLINSDAKFDLVILEIFVTESMIGLGHRFNAPVIGVGTFGSNNWINNLVGTPSSASVIPHPFLSYTDHMTFFQRVHNLAINAIDILLLNYFHYPLQKQIYDAAFPDPKPDFYHEVKNRVAFTFLNSHFSIAYPKPYVPNMVEIGGAQVKRNPKPLPADLQKFLDSAKDGAVYFSMGSNIKAKFLPVEIREGILKAIGRFPKVKFLWKWDDAELPGKPKNLFIQNWFPQDDLLAHPNVKCFITHGGLLSTTEAIYHGVPVIGIPVFGDQDLNTARATTAGYGLMVKYVNASEESLTWALTEMLTTDKYKKSAEEISRRYRDQPMTPLDTMTYWVEYVARHKGAPHLKSATQDLNFWQYHMLDVAAFFVAVVVLQIIVVKKLLKALCGGKKQVTPSQKKKRN